jgi:hypothetical protein
VERAPGTALRIAAKANLMLLFCSRGFYEVWKSEKSLLLTRALPQTPSCCGWWIFGYPAVCLASRRLMSLIDQGQQKEPLNSLRKIQRQYLSTNDHRQLENREEHSVSLIVSTTPFTYT